MTSTRPPERDEVDAIVAQWAQQRPELDTRTMEIFGRIYRLSAQMGERMEAAYAPYEISRGEFDVLAALRRSGPPYRLAPKDLARSLMITTGGMTGRLTRLTDAGLIRRVPHPSDKRCLYAELTETGLEVIDEAVGAGVDAQAFVADRLGDEQARALADHLRAALQILTTTPPQAQ
ncbi:MarR family winged helix-turn-helix transcriptional regulator [Kocuria sabuli]|uniref:MarR family winged helix-turn-helix transcriptional regulator n=1 Tax=Kocuria sabuli TaxID=3071448 RepID=UPI0034D53058